MNRKAIIHKCTALELKPTIGGFYCQLCGEKKTYHQAILLMHADMVATYRSDYHNMKRCCTGCGEWGDTTPVRDEKEAAHHLCCACLRESILRHRDTLNDAKYVAHLTEWTPRLVAACASATGGKAWMGMATFWKTLKEEIGEEQTGAVYRASVR